MKGCGKLLHQGHRPIVAALRQNAGVEKKTAGKRDFSAPSGRHIRESE